MQNTDTAELAHVLLPASTWGERDGMVTNSERRISRQRAFRKPPGEARPDWQIISQVASRLGYASAFDYSSPRQIFSEFAALSGKENNGSRDFDISALADLDDRAYEQFLPLQWPITFKNPTGTARLFEDGQFFTASKKAQMLPVSPRPPVNPVSDKYPLVLNTGRIRDQWHTMTRTGKSAKLSTHISEAFVQINSGDATQYKITDNDLVSVSSEWGEVIVRACISDEIPQGMVFTAMHWNDQYASRAVTGKVVNPACDPISGQPEFKHTPVSIKPVKKAWYGFLLSRRQLDLSSQDYWNLNKGHQLWRYEIAGNEMPKNWAAHARTLLCASEHDVAWMEYYDPSVKRYRAARLVGDKLESCIFIGPKPDLPNRDWLMALFDKPQLSDKDKAFLLSGRPSESTHDAGPSVCACFGVGRNTIIEAIQQQQLHNVKDIGESLKAGTNCGSCIPELKQLLTELGIDDS